MTELSRIDRTVSLDQVFLVVDAMTVKMLFTAKAFNEG